MNKTSEGDFKKMELTWGTDEKEAKRDVHGEKGVAALYLMDRRRKKKNLDR